MWIQTQFRQCVQLLEEDAEVASQLVLLIDDHQLKGKRIHDANLVATMRANGLARIRTDNPDDFQIFEGLTIETSGST